MRPMCPPAAGNTPDPDDSPPRPDAEAETTPASERSPRPPPPETTSIPDRPPGAETNSAPRPGEERAALHYFGAGREVAGRTVGTGLADGTAYTTPFLKSELETAAGNTDKLSVLATSELKKVECESRTVYQVGSLSFGDRPFYSTLFYGQGYMESVIKKSIADIAVDGKGSSISHRYNVLDSSICSSDSHIRNSAIGHRFLQFLKGFKDSDLKEPYYKGLVLLMIYLETPIMKVQFKDIKKYDFALASEIYYFYERIRQDLNHAAESFVAEFIHELQAICPKDCKAFSNLTVCIEGFPQSNGCLSLELFSKLPGMHFSEARTICSGATSMIVADTTLLGRVIGLNVLQCIFHAHLEKKTWNGQLNRHNIFIKNDYEVNISAPYHHKYTDAAAVKDLIAYVDEIFPLYELPKEGMPPFFNHLGRTLKKFKTPLLNFSEYIRRFQRFSLAHLALKSSMRRAVLFSCLYRIRQTRHVRRLLSAILNSVSFTSDWRKETLLKNHPILKRVYNFRNKVKDSRNASISGIQGNSKKGKKSELFPNTPEGMLICVRHTNEHGPEGPKPEDEKKENQPELEDEKQENQPELEEDPIKLLSDLDMLYSMSLEKYLPEILEVIIFAKNVPPELKIMLDEVFEEYNQPEFLRDVFLQNCNFQR